MSYIAILYIVFGQIPHAVVSATKDASMGLLIKLSPPPPPPPPPPSPLSSSSDLECENLWL